MSDQPPPKSFPFQTFFGAVLAVVLAASLFLVLQRLSGIEEKMAQLGEQVDATLKRLDAVDRRVQEAEASAQQAARLRDQAEERAVQARLETNQAQDEASQARREAGLARQDADQARKEREAELDRLQAALNRIVETRRTALGLVMNLGSDSLQFDFDKAALRPENREILSRVAGILFTFQDYAISVYGHTDDVGNAQYNQQLSERRAETVRDYLVQAGIDSSIITAKGFGKSRPLVESRTPQARAENRRVEIGIVNTRVLYTEPVSKTPH